MNKLTITDKVFVPVNVENYEINPLQKTVFSLQIGNGKCVKYAHDISSIDKYILKEETNKYILSREELEKIISDACDTNFSIEVQNVCGMVEYENLKKEYINSII